MEDQNRSFLSEEEESRYSCGFWWFLFRIFVLYGRGDPDQHPRRGLQNSSDTDQSEAAERDLDKDVPYCTTGRRDFI